MRARHLAPLIAAGAVAVVALIAAFAGPVQVGEPVIPFELRDAEPTPEPTLEAAGDELEDEEVPVNPFTVGMVFYTVVVGLAGLIIASVVLTWFVKWLLSRQPESSRAGGVNPQITIAAALQDAAELAVYEAEAARPGEATDAVVACWIILEQAAATAGTPRAAPQTPTEFTAAVLTEHRADRRAVETLLTLYHRARFGATPLPDEAAEAAADALRKISASLRPTRAEPGGRP